MTLERQLVERFPQTKWTEPLPTRTLGGSSGLACRFCIAIHGLRGCDVAKLPQTVEEFDAHIREKHGVIQ